MKLIGDLKKQVEQAKNKEVAKELIKKAGILLTNKELDEIIGGSLPSETTTAKPMGFCVCGQSGPLGFVCKSCGSRFE